VNSLAVNMIQRKSNIEQWKVAIFCPILTKIGHVNKHLYICPIPNFTKLGPAVTDFFLCVQTSTHTHVGILTGIL